MRLTIARESLARLISQAAKVVESKSKIPILSHVMLNAEAGAKKKAPGKLTAKGTDLDISVTASTDAAVEEAGAICVEAHLLAEIAKKVAGSEVALELKASVLHVSSGRSNYKLQTLPASDFPDIAQGTFTTEFEANLAALFAPVQFAISDEAQRFYLNGVYLHVVEGRLTAVATDGHRLARNFGQDSEAFAGVIVPKKLCGMLPEGAVRVELSDTKIRLTAGTGDADTTEIVSKLIDGTFPDYQRVIPTGNDKVVTADRDALRAAVDRVSIVSNERGSGVRFSFAPGGVDIAVRGNSEGVDAIPIEYDGEPLDVGINGKYVTEMLAAMSGGGVEFSIADSRSPVLVRSTSDAAWLGVLMPMRV